MRQVIIKAFLKAMSAFLIVYFLTIGIQYLGWKSSENWDSMMDYPIDRTPALKESDLPFTPILWPLAGHWYIYR